jgi:hypothetical protein
VHNLAFKNAQMTASQKMMIKDFSEQYFSLMEKYWNSTSDDAYWDSLTEDAMELISRFQTEDAILNNFLQNIVVAFMNSREESIS